MNGNNAFFKMNDPTVNSIAGYAICEQWWSRKYEYPWAFKFAHPNDICADMGCGWMQRPFKDALATFCQKVYAVETDRRVLQLVGHPGVMEFVIADFTKPIAAIADNSLDRVYCISVLEDLGIGVWPALVEFARCLKPDGRIVITTDVQYDEWLPRGQYPGMNLDDLFDAIDNAGLEFDGDIDEDKSDAVYHDGFNLCVWHCVLKRRE